MVAPFERLDVSSWRVIRAEAVGQSPTVWLEQPGKGADTDFHWLFKPVVVHSNGSRQGGDWAEKVCSELASLLNIPSAQVDLATFNGIEGSISKNVRPASYEMHSGRVWMNADESISYSSNAATKSKRTGQFSPNYTLDGAAKSLEDCGPPPGCNLDESLTALDVFSDYLIFDAIVANRDRHEDNWAILRPVLGDDTSRISAGYDYAGSLGHQLTDEKRLSLLVPGNRMGFEKWVNRGTAWRFDHGAESGPPTLVELARSAAELADYDAQSHWAPRLDTLNTVSLAAVFDRLPEMSEGSRRFASEVIVTNAGRIAEWLW